MDELVVQYILENHPNEARTRLSVGTTPLLKRALHLAVRRAHPEAASIVERFNAQLRGMIADRTYHRLLNVSWILRRRRRRWHHRARAEERPVGQGAAEQAYSLFSTDGLTTTKAQTGPRFYVGGNIYTDWAAVPNRYKYPPPNVPDSDSRTGTIFTFRW